MLLFEQFNQVGVSMLIASHDLSLITRLRHRILTLDQGVLIKDEMHPSRRDTPSRGADA
jgi:cell division transport system ATP-binding protein